MLPNETTRTCWIKLPPLLPTLDPKTSMAAFPLTFDSSSRGMYAIWVVGSNNAYLVALLSKLWTVPIVTASPSSLSFISPPAMRMTHAKNGTVTTIISIGVASAPTLHPKFLMTLLPMKITKKVVRPTTVEKVPMKRW